MDGTSVSVPFDLDSEKPVKSAEIGDFYVLLEFRFEGDDESYRRRRDRAVVDVDHDDRQFRVNSPVEHGLVDLASRETHGTHKDGGKLLVPSAARLLQTV